MDEHFWKIKDQFSEQAKPLKQEFDAFFANPLNTRPERFCWDYWYVKDQYKLIRTPADHFFSEQVFKSFIDELKKWGLNNLGCSQISPIWLSYYIDGCEQKLHTDSPHGPWAFVYSITNWSERDFSGGETVILKPETLCFWDYFEPGKSVEHNSLVKKIAPEFNRLTVFDPRFPHGVNSVVNAHEPKDARIVLHGWFTEPQPTFSGAHDEQKCHNTLSTVFESMQNELKQLSTFHGLLSLKFEIDSTGKVTNEETLCNTLIEYNSQNSEDDLIDFLCSHMKQTQFPSNENSYHLYLPLLFK